MTPVIAQRIAARPPRRRRSLDEQIYVRVRPLYRALARWFGKLSPRSRLRRLLLRRQLVSGWAAATRGDWDLMVIRYEPDVVYEVNPELVTLGLPPRVEGVDAWRRLISD